MRAPSQRGTPHEDVPPKQPQPQPQPQPEPEPEPEPQPQPQPQPEREPEPEPEPEPEGKKEMERKKLNAALMDAAKNSDVEAVRRCLRDGADPNAAGEYGNTALQNTADKNHLGCMGVLADAEADLDKADEDGDTPLGYGYPAAVEWLLKRGADWRLTNNDGKTALDNANEDGEAEVAAALEAWIAEHGSAEEVAEMQRKEKQRQKQHQQAVAQREWEQLFNAEDVSTMKLGRLRRHALSRGVTVDALEQALDAAEPRAMILSILEATEIEIAHGLAGSPYEREAKTQTLETSTEAASMVPYYMGGGVGKEAVLYRRYDWTPTGVALKLEGFNAENQQARIDGMAASIATLREEVDEKNVKNKAQKEQRDEQETRLIEALAPLLPRGPAKYNYPHDPDDFQEGDLTFSVGDSTVLLDLADEDWARGYVENRPEAVGVFPREWIAITPFSVAAAGSSGRSNGAATGAGDQTDDFAG